VKVKDIRGSPDLLVEIIFEWNRKYDKVTKRALYERTGVGEYWIVNPIANAVRVYRGNEAALYDRAAELSRDDVLTSPLFPNLKILARADLRRVAQTFERSMGGTFRPNPAAVSPSQRCAYAMPRALASIWL